MSAEAEQRKLQFEAGLLTVDTVCGVRAHDKLCLRPLNCKYHSVALKRAVEGRSRPFDEMLADFQNCVNETIVNDEIRAVILTGRGRAFCAGTDVSSGIARNHAEAQRERAARIKPVELEPSPLPSMWQLTRIPKPTIAAVNGAAVGMGVEWTAQCDFRIASPRRG